MSGAARLKSIQCLESRPRDAPHLPWARWPSRRRLSNRPITPLVPATLRAGSASPRVGAGDVRRSHRSWDVLGCSYGSWPYRSGARISARERWQLPFRAGYQEAVACRGFFDHPNHRKVPLQTVEKPSTGANAHSSRRQRALRPRSLAGVSVWFARAPLGNDVRPRN